MRFLKFNRVAAFFFSTLIQIYTFLEEEVDEEEEDEGTLVLIP